MAKVKPMGLIESMTGKVCQDSDISFVQRNGKVFTSKRCHPYTGEKTAKQRAHEQKFKAAQARAIQILKAGKGDETYDTLYAQWKASPGKYFTFRGYLFGQEINKD